MTYTSFMAGNYALESIADPLARARDYFEQLDGKWIMRKINLQKVPSDAVDLPQRPEYTPHIHIYQLKELGEDQKSSEKLPFRFVQFSQRYFVHNDFIAMLEKWLRENVTLVPTRDMDKVPQEFRHYYDTDFALLFCDYEKVTVHQKIAQAPEVDVLQPLGSAMIFKGVDTKAGATLRMIEPTLLETKLQEIEEKAVYMAAISKVKDVNEPHELLFVENKEAWNHVVMKRS